MTFQEWLAEVDNLFFVELGLSTEEFDYWWGELFDEGLTPQQAYEDFWENEYESY